jgi:hypothetical protein
MERIPFNLERALRGDALIDGCGNDVTGFKKSNSEKYPYKCDQENSYTENGTFYTDPCEDLDLFMKYPEHLEPERGIIGGGEAHGSIGQDIAANHPKRIYSCNDLESRVEALEYQIKQLQEMTFHGFFAQTAEPTTTTETHEMPDVVRNFEYDFVTRNDLDYFRDRVDQRFCNMQNDIDHIHKMSHTSFWGADSKPATPEMLEVVAAAVNCYKKGSYKENVHYLFSKVKDYLESQESK